MITEKIIDKYLDKRFPYKDQIQERENWRKELQFFANFLNESAESSRNEETIVEEKFTIKEILDKVENMLSETNSLEELRNSLWLEGKFPY